ncbi:MAG: hypothetical protein ABI262_06180 [Microcoleus sp.]
MIFWANVAEFEGSSATDYVTDVTDVRKKALAKLINIYIACK